MLQTPNPYCLLAELTYRCPLKCPYCSNPLKLRAYNSELDTTAWKRVLDEASRLGVVQVHFSGGEPLVRTDLAELVNEARQLGLYSHLSTSAAMPEESWIGRLQDAGLDALQISLQDSDRETSDWLAGSPSFDKKCRAVREAKRLEFPVTLNVVLHRHNLDRIREVIDLASQWGVDKLELAHTQYTGWAFRNRAALLPTRAQVNCAEAIVVQAREELDESLSILHILPDWFQQFPKACLQGWGRVYLTVAPDGAVLPCQTAREIPNLKFPNVRETSLSEIWFHSAVFQQFRGTDWMPEPCRSCDRREIDFGGCRCQAFLVTSNLAATDPVCHLSPQHYMLEQIVADALAEPADPQFRVFASD